MSPASSDLAAEVEALRHELVVLKSEVAVLRSSVSPSGGVTPESASAATPGPVGRRELLRGAGVAAAAVGGAALGVASVASPAAAATGASLNIGVTNSPTSSGDITTLVGALSTFASIPPGTASGVLVVTNTSATANSGGVVTSAANGFGVDAQSNGPFAAVRGIAINGSVGTAAGLEAMSSNGPALLVESPGWLGAPTNGTWKAGSIIRTRDGGDDNFGSLWYCAAAGTPGTWQKLAGPATAGSFHILPSTVRVWDSRPAEPPLSVPKGALSNGATDVIDCTLGGAVPTGATAAMVNLTITGTSAAGFLAAFKNGTSWPGNSSINWSSAGLTAANLVVVALDAQARFALKANVGCSTDFVVDVIGYYR